MTIQRLEATQLYLSAELEKLQNKSTKELAPIDEIVGQERAQKAVEFAMSIKEKGYNIYAIGQNGLGKRTMILRYLNRHQHDEPARKTTLILVVRVASEQLAVLYVFVS